MWRYLCEGLGFGPPERPWDLKVRGCPGAFSPQYSSRACLWGIPSLRPISSAQYLWYLPKSPLPASAPAKLPSVPLQTAWGSQWSSLPLESSFCTWGDGAHSTGLPGAFHEVTNGCGPHSKGPGAWWLLKPCWLFQWWAQLQQGLHPAADYYHTDVQKHDFMYGTQNKIQTWWKTQPFN